MIKTKENIDRRYLGALRFLDNATNAIVRRPLKVSAEGLRFATNLSNLHVITYAKGLENHLDKFEEAPKPPETELKPFVLNITDPLGEYLPRSFELKLPRNPEWEAENNIFTPVDIPLFQAPKAKLGPNWSIIRASVFQAPDNPNSVAIRGALLRILKKDNDKLLNSGISDERGEALIILPGIPITDFSRDEEAEEVEGELGNGDDIEGDEHNEWLATGDVVQMETPVKLEVIVEKGTPWPVDPENLEENKTVWRREIKKPQAPIELKLKPGQTQSIKLFVQMPNDV